MGKRNENRQNSDDQNLGNSENETPYDDTPDLCENFMGDDEDDYVLSQGGSSGEVTHDEKGMEDTEMDIAQTAA